MASVEDFGYFGFSNIPDGEEDLLFLEACGNSNIEICKQLKKEFVFEDDIDFLNRAFQRSSINGTPEMCQWLMETFNLDRFNVLPENLDDCFHIASVRGNINMFWFLYNNFVKIENSGATEKIENIHEFLYNAFKNGRKEFVNFLFHSGLVDKTDIDAMDEPEDNIYLTEEDRIELLSIREENLEFGSLTKAVAGY
jgi:hypothetical protein